MSDMKNDHYLAEMLEIMRTQGSKDNPVTLQLGIMQSANSVKIDDLVLNAEDLYIADYLVAGYTREIKIPYVSGVTVDTTQGFLLFPVVFLKVCDQRGDFLDALIQCWFYLTKTQ